ncbi:MAG: hypothetical protein IT355_01520 [Gemmatimonadaceae bacterium]|nr:hypothetical protein [Gemmatimonadaceae bacterium]
MRTNAFRLAAALLLLAACDKKKQPTEVDARTAEPAANVGVTTPLVGTGTLS